ncbi:type-F conjugative transfer system protein TrbI [Novosphingobium mathurense]|uniref:Type-F conjugative transfer system protein (TrbI_Ftype) n=1 Tax=Novosphingobium mathurense TaxID=428990 RepID=A0A1U6IJ94_9SPHN|nr:type-F conjugative transfer system protein TrbI [Novosphingobium mathurense]SLK08070.1 Type-F conjugative transfer system protein (TrbI_Ftype) [Novosphingobium mathurense]
MARSPRTSAAPAPSTTAGPLFEAEASTPPSAPRARIGLVPVAMVGALVAAGLWGAWVTKNVLGAADTPAIAKVQLAGIVGEYVQAQARSATPPEQVTTETRAFMGEVQKNLERRGASGQIVLVGEAVLAGNVPDITAEVRREVYAKVKMPQPANASAGEVMGAMRAAMNGQGVPQAASPVPGAALGGQGSAPVN